MKITDTPAVVFLTAVVSAFVMGGGALLWLDKHIDEKLMKMEEQISEKIREGKQGPPGQPGQPGKDGASGKQGPPGRPGGSGTSVYDGGTEASDGVTGHMVVGATMVQWGVAKSIPSKYAPQPFSPAFKSPPTVLCSADGAYLNDASCNLNAVTRSGFEFIVHSPSKQYNVGQRPVHWMAVGRQGK